MAAKVQYRVIRISEQTRARFKTYRDKTESKNHEALQAIIETAMPLLVKGLAELGIIPKAQSKFNANELNIPVEIYQSVFHHNNPDYP